MTWFLDYSAYLLNSLGKNPKATLADTAKAAYAATLAPHHSFMLRSIAKVAMSAAPSRRVFESRLFPGLSSEKTGAISKEISAKLDKIRNVFWKFYAENKIMEIP